MFSSGVPCIWRWCGSIVIVVSLPNQCPLPAKGVDHQCTANLQHGRSYLPGREIMTLKEFGAVRVVVLG